MITSAIQPYRIRRVYLPLWVALLILSLVSAANQRLEATSNADDVIFSELAWAGTGADPSDEWIELYNNTDSDIDLTGWAIGDGLAVTLNGAIPAHGFFLLERTDDNVVSDIAADQIYGGSLNNGGETLTLIDGNGSIVDTANSDGSDWGGGVSGADAASMERIHPDATDVDANWVTNDGTVRNGKDADGNPINGTPKARNTGWPPLEQPDLTVHKAGPSVVSPGARIAYEVTIANVGNGPAQGVALTDTLPSGLRYESDTSGVTPEQMPPNLLVWRLNTLDTGGTLTFDIHTAVEAGFEGQLANRVDVGAANEESRTNNNSDIARTSVTSATPGRIVINEIHADPDSEQGDANGDGMADTQDDEFVEIINNTGAALDLSGWMLGDAVSMRHIFPPATVLPDGCALVVFGGGIPTGTFGGALVQTASTGGLSLNNSSDTIRLLESMAAVEASLAYGSEANGDEAITRSPDLAGPAPLVRHSVAAGSGETLFSPGRLVDGTNFSGCPTPGPTLAKSAPHVVTPGASITYLLTVTNDVGFGLNSVTVSDRVPAGATFDRAFDGGSHSDDIVTWSIPSLAVGESQSVRFQVTAQDGPALLRNAGFTVSAANLPTPATGPVTRTFVDSATRIRHIQAAAHFSPLLGQEVDDVTGIVTAIVTRGNQGFFMQDPTDDGDLATSEGLFVLTGSDAGISVGDEVAVDGSVVEAQANDGQLTETQLAADPSHISVLSSFNDLPPPVVLGNGGRVPPARVHDDDRLLVFDAEHDGLDFYESLEGMRVQINDVVAVAPTTDDGEIVVVGDGGANASLLSARGALVIGPGDLNPERISLDNRFLSMPDVNTGARFEGPIVGIQNYRNSVYSLFPTQPLVVSQAGVTAETARPAADGELTVATFNVENLDPTDPQEKFDRLADVIVNRLHSPDLLGVLEVQDNNGTVDDGMVAADQTYARLIQAVQTAGGPIYAFRQIDPVDGADAGAPGGNIRVAFLLRTDRGLAFVDRPGGDATTPTAVVNGASGPELSLSPGRVDPGNGAFNTSRKPLAGEFTFNGQKLFVVVTHFNAKGGDDPVMGTRQPPVFSSEAKRSQQTQAVNDFVDAILAADGNANVIVLGDMNDFHFSGPIRTLAGDALTNLVEKLPENDRYSYIFQGNAQVLDHILISQNLARQSPSVDMVHTSAEFMDHERATDHDQALAYFRFGVQHEVFLPFVTR